MGVLPYFILSFLFYTICWGVIPAFLHSVFCAVTAVLLMEVFFVNYRKMPFVSAYVPGKFRIKYFWPLYIAGFTLYIILFSLLGRFLLGYPAFYIFYYGSVVTDLYWIRWYRYKRNKEFCFIFDEEPEPAMLSLGFDESAWRPAQRVGGQKNGMIPMGNEKFLGVLANGSPEAKI